MEANLLNTQKTGKAPKEIKVSKQIHLSKVDVENTANEKLGLDEDGHIKVSHGIKEI